MGLNSRYLRYLVRTQPTALVGAIIVTLAIVLAVVGPVIAPFDAQTAYPGNQLQPPSVRHPTRPAMSTCRWATRGKRRTVHSQI